MSWIGRSPALTGALQAVALRDPGGWVTASDLSSRPCLGPESGHPPAAAAAPQVRGVAPTRVAP